MCGRFSLSAKLEELLALVDGLSVLEMPPPRFNIAPTQMVATTLNEPQRQLTECRWGLIPFWAKDNSIGAKLINARSETAAERPSFKISFEKKRCLIFADGFYEWHLLPDSKIKQPYFIRLKSQKPFAFAGLWDNWQDGEKETIRSCTILTTDANSPPKPIHQRMPVILPPDTFDLWLSPESVPPAELMPLLKPFAASLMEAYPISNAVNKVKNDNPNIQQPVRLSSTGRLFN